MSKRVEIEIFSVEERLPQKSNTVLGHYSEGDSDDVLEWINAYYCRRRKVWVDDHGPIDTGNITHWFIYPEIK